MICRLSLITVCLYCFYAFGQDDIITMKAVFIERFTRFIEWPSDSVEKPSDTLFCLMILGENPFGKTMERLLTTTKMKGKKTSVIYSNKLRNNEIRQCQMVYISPSIKKSLKETLDTLRNYSVVTIGDTKGYADEGVMINFVIEKDMLRFEINLKEFRRSQLICGSDLLKIAKIIGN